VGFQFPEAFALLLILPPLLWRVWRGGALAREIAGAFKGRAPGRWHSGARLTLIAAFLGSLIAVGARPYVVPGMTGNYLLISDVSRSMDARHSCREPTLLDRSKGVMQQVIAGLPEGRFGIVAFERLAFPVTQMTYDHSYLNDVIAHGLFVGLIYDHTATQFANALSAVVQKKERLPDIYGRVNYAILVTDGNISPSEEGRFREVLMRLRDTGIRLLIVGIGSSGGTPIPVVQNGKCLDQPIAMDGQPVRVSLRADILQSLAGETEGRYFGEAAIGELVAFLRRETLQKASSDVTFGAGQRKDMSWVFLVIATVALAGIILLNINPRFGSVFRVGDKEFRWTK